MGRVGDRRRSWELAGVDEVLLWPVADEVRQMTPFTEDVAPHFKERTTVHPGPAESLSTSIGRKWRSISPPESTRQAVKRLVGVFAIGTVDPSKDQYSAIGKDAR